MFADYCNKMVLCERALLCFVFCAVCSLCSQCGSFGYSLRCLAQVCAMADNGQWMRNETDNTVREVTESGPFGRRHFARLANQKPLPAKMYPMFVSFLFASVPSCCRGPFRYSHCLSHVSECACIFSYMFHMYACQRHKSVSTINITSSPRCFIKNDSRAEIQCAAHSYHTYWYFVCTRRGAPPLPPSYIAPIYENIHIQVYYARDRYEYVNPQNEQCKN